MAPAPADEAKPMDIFSLVAEAAASSDAPPPPADAELIFVGGKGAGKTTLINGFLMKDEVPKPTTALEYRFARRSAAGSSSVVANVWELGGGTQLAEMLPTVLRAERLSSTIVAVVLDFAAPDEALGTLLFWLGAVRGQVDRALGELACTADGAAKAAEIRAKAAALWVDHDDGMVLTPPAVPLVIIASKWDAFEEAYAEGEYRKLVTRTLRYLAHQAGASLICSRHKDKGNMTAVRNLLYHHVFGTAGLKAVSVEHSKPLVCPASSDSFSAIGKPPRVEGVISDEPAEMWRAAFDATFPPKPAKAAAQDLSMVEAEQFAEEAIDDLRRTKRDELGRLRHEREQQLKLDAASAL